MLELARPGEAALNEGVYQADEVQLTRTGLHPTGMIGELDQLDEVPAGVQMPWDIAVHRLNVGVVEDETDGRMIRLAHHLDRIPKMMQEHVREPPGAHRFDAQLHTLARHLVGKSLEIGRHRSALVGFRPIRYRPGEPSDVARAQDRKSVG